MIRLFAFVSETLSRRALRGAARPDVMSAWSENDRDAWDSYVGVLEEARGRRGELFSRF